MKTIGGSLLKAIQFRHTQAVVTSREDEKGRTC